MPALDAQTAGLIRLDMLSLAHRLVNGRLTPLQSFSADEMPPETGRNGLGPVRSRGDRVASKESPCVNPTPGFRGTDSHAKGWRKKNVGAWWRTNEEAKAGAQFFYFDSARSASGRSTNSCASRRRSNEGARLQARERLDGRLRRGPRRNREADPAFQGRLPHRRDAQRFLTETLGRLGDGSYAAPSKLTLGEYLTGEWLPAIEGTLRPLSVTQYQSVVRNRIVPRIGGLRLQGVSGAHLNALLRDLEEAGLSAASRRQTYAVLSRAFRDAVRWGRLVRNPAAAADPPAASEARVTAWTAKELTRFLDHVGDDRLSALWRLAATTGLRRGELLGATWFALDTAGGTLRVDQQLVPTRGCVTFGPPKSKRSRRTVALDAVTLDALAEHRDAQLLERAFAGDAYIDRDLLFCDEVGNPIYPQRLTEAFLRHRDAAKIP